MSGTPKTRKQLLEEIRSLRAELERLKGGERDRPPTEEIATTPLETEERLRIMAEAVAHSVSGLAIRDEKGRLIYVNRAFLRFWGYQEEREVLGRSAAEFWAEPSQALRVVRDALQGRSWGGEMVAKRKDGSEFIAHVTVRQMTVGDGPIRTVMGCVIDISEHKRTERRVELLATAVEQSSAGLFIVDRDGRIQLVNKAFVDMLGYSVDEQVGKHFSLWHSAETIKAAQAALNHCWRDGGFHGELWHVRRDGSKLLTAVQGVPIRGENGEWMQAMASCTDLTELRKAEEAARQGERLRIEAERLMAKGQLAAEVAHEINNPLAGIMQSLRLVKAAVPAGHPDAKYVEVIEKELRRIAGIVRLTYKLVRPDPAESHVLQLRESVAETILMLRPESEQRLVQIVCTVDAPEAISGIPDNSVRQVLFNLLKNAMEASPSGCVVRLVARTTDSSLVLTVSDDGAGIPPDAGSLLFEPFFTTKGSHRSQGLGLGLWIVKGIVNSLGGIVDYESALGRGTTFRVFLPFPVLGKKGN